tara:strand:+ start:155 stop:613 length:459 start_codon:yes stop_codon:yes gene_type:complete
MILIIINISLIKIIVNNYTEGFESPSMDIENKLRMVGQSRLNVVKDDSSLFSEFCKKIKYFDENYSNTTRLKKFNKESKLDNLENNKKKINTILKEIFTLQEKIYFNKNDIAYFKQYEEKMNKNTREYIVVLDKVIENLKNNLSSNIILNIK